MRHLAKVMFPGHSPNFATSYQLGIQTGVSTEGTKSAGASILVYSTSIWSGKDSHRLMSSSGDKGLSLKYSLLM